MTIYRGRLIQPFRAEIARLDTAATRAAGGYDDTFRSPKITYPGGVRTSSRVESTAIRLNCQVEQGNSGAQRQSRGGNIPDSEITLVFFAPDLEEAGLVDASGYPMLQPNDRLVALYTDRDVLVQTMRPSLYATHVQPTAFGIGRRRNLVVVTFEDRPQGKAV